MDDRFSLTLRAAHGPGPHYVDGSDASWPPTALPAQLIAFYLPQFHPIPENDKWWGAGFTEWANVTRGLPRFEGHHQPCLPADLGFYDLRLAETLRQQAVLARRYGISGFCFHHYWFGGKRLLERPVQVFLENPDIDISFCLCWANENWTRRWDGLDSEILISQEHSEADDVAFIRDLMPMFRDRRYLRVGARPVVVIYRPHLLPDPVATARRWRTEMAEADLGDPFLVMVQGFGQHDPRLIGFDAAVEFPPHKLGFGVAKQAEIRSFEADFAGEVLDYDDMVRRGITQPKAPYHQIYGVCPRWDNEARKRGRGTTFANATPTSYRTWLAHNIGRTIAEQPPERRLVFINSWNEWAEGAHLEPDRHFGHAFLSATADALSETAKLVTEMPVSVAPPDAASGAGLRKIAIIAHDAHYHGAQLLALNLTKSINEQHLAEASLLLGEGGELQREMSLVAPTKVVGAGFEDLAAWQSEAARLKDAGVAAVFCNSVVSCQALPALRAAGLPTICLVHELPTLLRDYGLEQTARAVAQSASVVVFPNSAVHDSFVAAYGCIAGRTLIKPQGLYRGVLPPAARSVAREQVRTRLAVQADERLIVGLGYGDHRKGLDLWPAIAKAACDLGLKCHFVWVGAVDPNLRRSLELVIRDLKLDRQISFAGRTDAPQEYLAAADLYLLSSREDPFPSAALEAAAHGVPVICFEGSGGMPAFARETGLRAARMEDPISAASVIAEALRDEQRRSQIGSAAARLVGERASFASYASTLLEASLPSTLPVTAVVPNYNYAHFLEERLRSIWNQTLKPAEIVVLDDASADGSDALLERLRQHSPVPMRVVKNDVNSGSVSRQWELGVRLARTPLVWIAEADDSCEPEFLQEMVNRFCDPSVVLAYSQSQQMDAAGRVIAPNYLAYTDDIDTARWRSTYVRSGFDEIASALAVKNTIPNVSATVMRRDAALDAFGACLPDMISLRNAGDWCFYIGLLQRGRVAYCEKALNSHRRHSSGVTLSAANRGHLNEIARMQALARRVTPVAESVVSKAERFLREATRYFGLTDSEADDAVLRSKVEGSDCAWFEAICAHAEGRMRMMAQTDLLPDFPAESLQIATTGQAGVATLREAFDFYKICRNGFERLGRRIRRGDRLLDFGVGWGRIGRFFLRDIHPSDLIGLDVDRNLIELCKGLFPEGVFQACSPLPPSDIPDGSVQFVVGYSVFSHLSEEACAAWMREFHRILAPGGMVALTTRGRWFFDYCDALRTTPSKSAYEVGLSELFDDLPAARRRYDAGQFVFASSESVGGGGPRNPSFYGETFIPEAYAASAWLPEMELLEFHVDEAQSTHPVLFLRRRELSSSCSPK